MSRFLDFYDALYPYREPRFGCISNRVRPPDNSLQNLLLVWSTGLVHMNRLYKAEPPPRDFQDLAQLVAERDRFSTFVNLCTLSPGTYLRYPADSDRNPTTHDDLTGIAVASLELGLPYGRDILAYGKRHLWKWKASSNVLDREYLIQDFPATIRFCGNSTPWPWEEGMFKVGLEGNYYEPAKESSGRCLEILKALACYGHEGYPRIDLAITHWWQTIILPKFPDGKKGIYRLYFGESHPFTVFADQWRLPWEKV